MYSTIEMVRFYQGSVARVYWVSSPSTIREHEPMHLLDSDLHGNLVTPPPPPLPEYLPVLCGEKGTQCPFPNLVGKFINFYNQLIIFSSV